MAVGACILAAYRWSSRVEAKRFAPIIASALIAGDGVWCVPSGQYWLQLVGQLQATLSAADRALVRRTVISAILALAGAVAPMCLTVRTAPCAAAAAHQGSSAAPWGLLAPLAALLSLWGGCAVHPGRC